MQLYVMYSYDRLLFVYFLSNYQENARFLHVFYSQSLGNAGFTLLELDSSSTKCSFKVQLESVGDSVLLK